MGVPKASRLQDFPQIAGPGHAGDAAPGVTATAKRRRRATSPPAPGVRFMVGPPPWVTGIIVQARARRQGRPGARPPSLSGRRGEGAAETERWEPVGGAHARPAAEEPRDGLERAPRVARVTEHDHRHREDAERATGAVPRGAPEHLEVPSGPVPGRRRPEEHEQGIREPEGEPEPPGASGPADLELEAGPAAM